MAATRCYYEVLGLDRSGPVGPEDVKKAYRALALKLHPDRNPGSSSFLPSFFPHPLLRLRRVDDQEEATRRFKELVTAYEILSDPAERRWYDDHRSEILRSRGAGAAAEDEDEDHIPDLFPFFTSACNTGFNDGDDGFYNVYAQAFQSIIDKENDCVLEHNDSCGAGKGSKLFIIVPPFFGDAATHQKDVLKFYNYWTNFVTLLSFSWKDKYNPNEAPDRQTKRCTHISCMSVETLVIVWLHFANYYTHVDRLIEKENKKFRDDSRKEYVDTVRALAAYVKKRDERARCCLCPHDIMHPLSILIYFCRAIKDSVMSKKKEEELRRQQQKEQKKAKKKLWKEVSKGQTQRRARARRGPS